VFRPAGTDAMMAVIAILLPISEGTLTRSNCDRLLSVWQTLNCPKGTITGRTEGTIATPPFREMILTKLKG